MTSDSGPLPRKVKAARYAALLKANAVAPQDYDDAEAAYKQALANAQTARINLGYTHITAPITGRIGAPRVTQGALVTADQTTALATIQPRSHLCRHHQSSAELLALKLAMQGGHLTNSGPADARVTLQLDNGTAYPQNGKLQFTEVTVDPTTGAVTLRAIFPNPDGLLLPGMYVRATIIEGVQNNAILVPQQGVGRNEKGEPTAVGRRCARTSRACALLKTWRAIGGNWQVMDGLKPGDKLIVEGLQKVVPDMPVHAVPASFAKTGQAGRRLMGLSRFFIDRPVFAWVIAIVIMLAGMLAIQHPADRAISHHRAARGGDQRHLSRRRRRRPCRIPSPR